MLTDVGIVTDTEYPHGLRCFDCEDLMPEGTALCEVPNDVIGRFRISVVLCPACAVERDLP